MKHKTNIIKLTLMLVMLMFAAQGCVAKKETVKLIPAPQSPVSCYEVLAMDIEDVSDHQLQTALDSALYENEMTCWRLLVQKALEKDRDVPKSHLSRAVHEFNKNKTQELFSLATHRYFVELAQGNGVYDVKDKELMKAWLGFEIRRAQTKKDDRLIRAKRVCRALDTHLYEKFFL